MKLYSRQIQEVERALASGTSVRWMFAMGTGTGKTPTSITTVNSLNCKRILIVCPAIVRLHWQSEFAKWSYRSVEIIDYGRARKLSKKAAAQRDKAYAADVQAVSYDLLKEVDQTGWDAVIFDECHNLGDPLSKQSKMARDIILKNPDAHVLMLSATPIPTVGKQVWHPLWLLHGSKVWGKPTNTGNVSWQFANKYCSIEHNEYGTFIGNLTDTGASKLREDMAPYMSRVTMDEIAPEMPPLNVCPQFTDKDGLEFYVEWMKNLPKDINHVAILVHHKELARNIHEEALKLFAEGTVFYVDGEIQATRRSELLLQIEARPTGLLVGTHDSISTGIRLTFVQTALIGEFSASPGVTAQVLGRFASVGSQSRPLVHVVVGGQSFKFRKRLMQRTEKIAEAYKLSMNEQAIEKFAKVDDHINEDVMSKMMLSMLDDMNDELAEWENDDD